MSKNGYVYFLMNKTRTVIYVGVTNDLQRRVYEHKQELVAGFTKKYSVHDLVYYEEFDTISDAINREKQIKGGSRRKKEELALSVNPKLTDLYDSICS
jgi:putative endonuclease